MRMEPHKPTPTLDEFQRRFRDQELRAEAIRAILDLDLQIVKVKEAADHAHREYPQYRCHWDGPEWKPVRFRRRVVTKMGEAFVRGDVTLARMERGIIEPGKVEVFAYSVRNGIDTLVHVETVTWLDGEPELIRERPARRVEPVPEPAPLTRERLTYWLNDAIRIARAGHFVAGDRQQEAIRSLRAARGIVEEVSDEWLAGFLDAIEERAQAAGTPPIAE